MIVYLRGVFITDIYYFRFVMFMFCFYFRLYILLINHFTGSRIK